MPGRALIYAVQIRIATVVRSAVDSVAGLGAENCSFKVSVPFVISKGGFNDNWSLIMYSAKSIPCFD